MKKSRRASGGIDQPVKSSSGGVSVSLLASGTRRDMYDDSLLRSHANMSIINMKGFGLRESMKNEGLAAYWNPPLSYLLIFVPIGIIAGWMELGKTTVFFTNFLAIIPVALLIGSSTEDISCYTNETLAGLLNSTMGNITELIISVQALRMGMIDLVKSSLMGSILSNLLLVLGSSFLYGGSKYSEQYINPVVVSSSAGILAMVMFGFSIPAMYNMAVGNPAGLDKISLLTAIGLLLLYGLYLTFQLITHKEHFDHPEPQNGGVESGDVTAEEEQEEDEPHATLLQALGILAASCLLVAVNSDYLVDSVDGVAQRFSLPPSFIALILLPIVGNATEHFSAISVAGANKIDLSIGIACGSSIQIAVFVTPFLVVCSWVLGFEKHLTLNFDPLETVIVVVAVILVNTLMIDNRSNWFKGALLVVAYFIVAAAFFFFDG